MRTLVAPIVFNEMPRALTLWDKFRLSPAHETCDFVMMNDGSEDGFEKACREKGIPILSHSKRQGVGAAIRTVLKEGLSKGYDSVVIMAGNTKDDPAQIPLLLEPLLKDKADFVQGSRFLKGGRYDGLPFHRLLATRWLHPALMSFFSGKKVTDSTNGFRALKLALLRDPRIQIDQPWLDRYELEPYLLFKTLTCGFRYQEIPVSKIYPLSDKMPYSKMKPWSDWWSILRPVFLLGLGLRK